RPCSKWRRHCVSICSIGCAIRVQQDQGRSISWVETTTEQSACLVTEASFDLAGVYRIADDDTSFRRIVSRPRHHNRRPPHSSEEVTRGGTLVGRRFNPCEARWPAATPLLDAPETNWRRKPPPPSTLR